MPQVWHFESTSSPRRWISAGSPAVRNCFKCPQHGFPFSFFSLQTVCAFVIRLGTAMVSVADMSARIVHEIRAISVGSDQSSKSDQQSLAQAAGANASLDDARCTPAFYCYRGRRSLQPEWRGAAAQAQV